MYLSNSNIILKYKIVLQGRKAVIISPKSTNPFEEEEATNPFASDMDNEEEAPVKENKVYYIKQKDTRYVSDRLKPHNSLFRSALRI